jgi:hypothetical protein
LRRRRTTLREEGGGSAALPAEGVPIAGGCATAGCPATERLLVTVRLRLPNRVLMHCPYRLWGRAHNGDGPKILPHGFGAFSGRRQTADLLKFGSPSWIRIEPCASRPKGLFARF